MKWYRSSRTGCGLWIIIILGIAAAILLVLIWVMTHLGFD